MKADEASEYATSNCLTSEECYYSLMIELRGIPTCLFINAKFCQQIDHPAYTPNCKFFIRQRENEISLGLKATSDGQAGGVVVCEFHKNNIISWMAGNKTIPTEYIITN
tara:strand:- start:220 stop:546 length:327 start_codon:yes stop_codon:yes gene_type:complete